MIFYKLFNSLPAPLHRYAGCSTAVSSVADDRQTMGVTAVVRAADGRRTMSIAKERGQSWVKNVATICQKAM